MLIPSQPYTRDCKADSCHQAGLWHLFCDTVFTPFTAHAGPTGPPERRQAGRRDGHAGVMSHRESEGGVYRGKGWLLVSKY